MSPVPRQLSWWGVRPPEPQPPAPAAPSRRPRARNKRPRRAAPPDPQALKSGLYARHYTPEQVQALARMEPTDYLHEILANRVLIDAALGRALLPGVEPETLLHEMNAIARATNSIVNAGAKHARLNPATSPAQSAWEQALLQEAFFEGEAPG
jgi:hypothetical protein